MAIGTPFDKVITTKRPSFYQGKAFFIQRFEPVEDLVLNSD
jgi:hypothetical protein